MLAVGRKISFAASSSFENQLALVGEEARFLRRFVRRRGDSTDGAKKEETDESLEFSHSRTLTIPAFPANAAWTMRGLHHFLSRLG